MPEEIAVLIYTGAAGLAIPAGGALARIARIRPRWLERELRHGVLAFGGGILMAAVALVLVPESIEKAPGALVVAGLLLGGVAFMLVDRALAGAEPPPRCSSRCCSTSCPRPSRSVPSSPSTPAWGPCSH